jgi:hypothetical protein
MIKFKEYCLLNEAIPLIIAKNAFGRKHLPENYTDKMNKAFNNKDRIILPFKSENNAYSKTENLVRRKLYNYFMDHKDYIEGYATDGKQKYKIGKILQSLGEYDLLDEFKKDESRQFGNKEFVIVISRHPYDIAGASDDRNWSSCLTKSFPPIVYRDKKEKDKRTGSYSKRIDQTDDYINYDKLKSGNYDFERYKCDTRSIIAYLVPKEELMKNQKIALRKPVSRMLFFDYDDSYEFTEADIRNPVYGLDNDDFKKEVEKWMSLHFTYYGDDEDDY